MKIMIENFVSLGGKHCITNALRQIFMYYGYPMSEEMLFGLASGLSFIYLNQAHAPMLSGRTKVFAFEEKLAQRLQIKIRCKSARDNDKVMQITKEMIKQNHPVLVYVDMPYLKYLGMDQQNHFGGHAVVLFGYDDEREQFWVSDRDQDDYPIRTQKGNINENYHLVDYQEIMQARSSSHRPFPAKNKYLIFDFSDYQPVGKQVLVNAIKETCDTMLYPPAQLLGINGIYKFSKEILKWNKFSATKFQIACITNYFQIHADGGTGGGLFRQMYGTFLMESAKLMQDSRLEDIGNDFLHVATLWDHVAVSLWDLSKQCNNSCLSQLSYDIQNIYAIEKQLYLQLQTIVETIL